MLEKLWNELLEQKPTNGDLRYVIRYVEALRGEARKLLARKLLRCPEEIIEDMIRNQ